MTNLKNNTKEPGKSVQRASRALLTLGVIAGVAHFNTTLSECRAGTMPLESNATDGTELSSSNPFAKPSDLPFHAPDFTAIRDEHFKPAFLEGMKKQLAEMQSIADQTADPTFENTIEAMEKSGALLLRTQSVFFNMTSAHTNKTIQEVQSELAPLIAAHSDNIYLNQKLFARVKDLYEKRDTLNLTEEQSEVLRQTHESFVRAGAELTDAQQERIRLLNEQLSTLETKFEEALLAVTKERAVLVNDVKRLDGMSEGEIAAAAQAAKDAGHDSGYLLAITNTTRVPTLSSLNNRETRKRLWMASAYRA